MDFLENLLEGFGRKKKFGDHGHGHDRYHHEGHDGHHDNHDHHGWGENSIEKRTSSQTAMQVSGNACCGAPLPDKARFCPLCGTAVLRPSFCPGCGLQLQDEAKFCHGCGQGIR